MQCRDRLLRAAFYLTPRAQYLPFHQMYIRTRGNGAIASVAGDLTAIPFFVQDQLRHAKAADALAMPQLCGFHNRPPAIRAYFRCVGSGDCGRLPKQDDIWQQDMPYQRARHSAAMTNPSADDRRRVRWPELS